MKDNVAQSPETALVHAASGQVFDSFHSGVADILPADEINLPFGQGRLQCGEARRVVFPQSVDCHLRGVVQIKSRFSGSGFVQGQVVVEMIRELSVASAGLAASAKCWISPLAASATMS